MKEKSLEEILKNKSVNFKMKPKPDLWQKIEPHLKNETKNKKIGFYHISAFLIICILSIFSFKFFNQELIKENNQKILSINKNIEQEISLNIPKKSLELKDKNESFFNDNKHVISNNSNLIKNTSNVSINNLKSKSDYISKNHESLSHYRDKIFIKKFVDNSNMILNDTTLSENKNNLISEIVLNTKDSFQDKINEKDKNEINSKKPEKNQTKNTFYASLLTNYFISNSLISSKVDIAIKAKKSDKKISNLGFGILAGLKLNKHNFFIGLNYLSLGYQRTYFEVHEYNQNALTPVGNTTILDSINFAPPTGNQFSSFTFHSTIIKNQYKYLTVPLGYQYQILNRNKFNFSVLTNFALTFLFQKEGVFYNNQLSVYENYKNQSSSSMKFGSSSSIGIELGYKFNQNINLVLRPQIGISLNKIELQQINTKHRFWGSELGLTYYFIKNNK